MDQFLTTAGAVVTRIWTASTTVVPPPDKTLIYGTALMALLIVLITPTWHLARHVVTIAHEGAHALVALLTGRRLDAIKLHSDTSGLTLSAGKPRGLGMIATAFAGYVGPGLLGLGAAWLLGRGYAIGLLWALIALLALLLLKVRNLFGLWSVLVAGAALVAVSWWLDETVQTLVAYVVTWFLLFGAIRPVIELQTLRARGRARQSDADQLARLTHLPGLFWVLVFLATTLGALALGASWII